MCVAAAGLMTIASLGLSAIGTLFQVQSLQAQRSVAKENQRVANFAAADALERGEIAETEHRRRIAGLVGTGRSVLASHGVMIDEPGGSLEFTSDIAEVGALEGANIRANAEREAFQLRMQGASFGAEADLSRSEQISTALGGASDLAINFGRAKRRGDFT